MIYIALGYYFIFALLFMLLHFFPKYTVSAKVYRNGLIILIFMVIYIAYRYIPVRSDDLYRHYLIIERMRDRGWKWAFFNSTYSYEPFSNILFMLVAKMTNNNAIFQTVGVILIYGMLFLCIKKVTGFKIGREGNLFLVTFLSFVLLIYSVSGMRNTLAALFFAYGLYSENTNITKKSWIFYFLSVCTHMGLLPVVLIRVLTVFFPKTRINIVHVLLCFWSLFVSAIISIFSEIENRYVRSFIRKLSLYAKNVVTQEFEIHFIIATVLLCILLAVIYYFEARTENSYTTFMGYLVAATLGCLISTIIFERFVRVVCACGLPLFINLQNEKRMKKEILMYSIVVLDLGMLCYQAWIFIYNFDRFIK